MIWPFHKSLRSSLSISSFCSSAAAPCSEYPAMAADGRKQTVILGWGSGEDGQLGMEDWERRDSACVIKSESFKDVSAVVAGSRNSLAICHDGTLFTWGWNQRGTLGHAPEAKTESVPGPVEELSDVMITQAAIGGWHCLAVDDLGRVYAWGGNEYGQCGKEPDRTKEGRYLRRDIVIPQRCAPQLSVRQVDAGGTHSLVLTTDGHVWTWGQPWPPGDINQIWTPVKVQGLEKVHSIAVGAFHNLALQESGMLWAWGSNEYGQLGIGDTQPRSQPVLVQTLPDLTLATISAGGWHSAALTDDGEVYAWGRGEHGRLGLGEDKSSKMLPQKVQLLEGEHIIQVSCGGSHSVALTRDGRMFSYGRGDDGRLGNNGKLTNGHPMEVSINVAPPKIDGATAVIGQWRAQYIACGGRHTIAIATWSDCR